MILHVAAVFGGAERTTRNLLARLDRLRFPRITVIAPEAMRPHFALPQVEFHALDASDFAYWYQTQSRLWSDASRFRKLVQQYRPDILMGMMHYSASVAVLGARMARFPGVRLASFRGPAYEHIRRYEPRMGRRLFSRAAIVLTGWLADGVIVPSRGTADELARRFYCPPRKAAIIPNGIDLSETRELARKPWVTGQPFLTGRSTVITAARLSPEKRIDTLLRAFALVAQKYPVDLAIVGDGPSASVLRALAAELGIGSRIRWLGHQENVFPFLRQSTCFVHCCDYEGFGYAMLEALACGLPVVAEDCPYGPREVLGDGEFGCLVPPADPAAMASALETMIRADAEREQLAALGLKRAAYFSLDRMVANYESVFLDLLRKRARRV